MVRAFTVPKQAYDGFLDLIAIGSAGLAMVAAESKHEKLTLDVPALAARLSAKVQCERDRLERGISTVVLPLSSLRASFAIPADEFLRLLDEQITRQNPDWLKVHKEKWDGVHPQVADLISKNGYFSELQKAFQLLANRPAMVREFKILTELRPVYDDELTAAKALLLSNTLVIDYEDGESWRRLHLTVDEQDLVSLQDQITRARAKAALMKEQAGKLDVPFLVAGAAQG
jgi:hypothetical protein